MWRWIWQVPLFSMCSWQLCTNRLRIKSEYTDTGARHGFELTRKTTLLKLTMVDVLDRSMTLLVTTDLEKVGLNLYGWLSAELSSQDPDTKVGASLIAFPQESTTSYANAKEVDPAPLIFHMCSRSAKHKKKVSNDLVLVLADFKVDEKELIRKIGTLAKKLGLSRHNLLNGHSRQADQPPGNPFFKSQHPQERLLF